MSINKWNKLVNADLKYIVNWLNANKISLTNNLKQLSLNVSKRNLKVTYK